VPKNVTRFPIRKIKVVGKRRHLNRRKCERIAESIGMIGLRTPITVYVSRGGKITLVAGLHRLKAMKLRGEKKIDCFVVHDRRVLRELWQDEENLCKASLTALERAEATARSSRNARKLAKTKADAMIKGGTQPGDKGLSKSARRLGLSRETVRRAIEIDAISADAKEAARECGLDRNQDALLKVAKQGSPEEQVRKVRELSEGPEPKKLSKAERRELKDLLRRASKAEKLLQAIAKASPPVQRKFAGEFVKLCRKSRSTESA
jgi:ParB family transcriptional regulator, chromosome partitioning protein